MIITVEIAQLRDCNVLAKGKIVHAIVACSMYTTGRISISMTQSKWQRQEHDLAAGFKRNWQLLCLTPKSEGKVASVFSGRAWQRQGQSVSVSQNGQS